MTLEHANNGWSGNNDVSSINDSVNCRNNEIIANCNNLQWKSTLNIFIIICNRKVY